MTREGSPYDGSFYDDQWTSSQQSATVVVPIALELFHPSSVVDVGCGVGHWLAEFCRLGVDDVAGVDGPYVERERLRIPVERFHPHDLEQPIDLGRRFDLAMSVEVAEHLDERAADQFVDTLTSLAPTVLFSAAIPGQDGTHHVNLQWPPYWVDKFAARGYRVFDIVRPRVWNDLSIDWTYAQNLLVFATAEAAERHRLDEVPTTNPLSFVHPRHLEVVLASNVSKYSPKALAQALPTAVVGSVRRRLPGRLRAR